MEPESHEKSSLEILRDFANRSGRRIETTEDRLTSTGFLSFQHTRRTAFILNNPENDLIFYWYNNPKSFSLYSMYSGLFFKTNIPESSKIMIRKKIFSDLFMFPFSNKNHKTGDYRFDSKYILTGFGCETIQPVFNNPKVQNIISELMDLDQRIQISINSFSPEFGPIQNTKNLVGILIKDFWILESEVIEKIFHLSSVLKNELN
jgi:hypothetical protein